MKKNIKNVENKKSGFYYSYSMRLIITCFMFIGLLITGYIFMLKAFVLEEAREIKYSEHSNLDYKVNLRENNFYEEKYLPKDMVYVANLIDKIRIDFSYKFSIAEKIDLEFKYDLVGKLLIQDNALENTYFEKEYTLISEKSVPLKDGIEQKINESVDIDYVKYNELANSFKTSYGLNTKSRFVVYFRLKKKDSNSLGQKLLINDSSSGMIVSIPLSEKSVNITLDYKDINNDSKVLDNSRVIVDNIIYLIISIIAIILSLVFMVKFIRLISLGIVKRNKYDKYISKLLNEYDRLIVETTSPPIKSDADKDKIINILKFTELLDVRDNLKLPIMYYVVAEHQKCHFYINSGDKIYLLTIKNVDLEVKNEDK